MIKNFFHGLNSSSISYLLISGQAAVLYGGATFSEDIDLWVEPKIDNWNRFTGFLNEVGAKVYKLTPPISMEFIEKGHGFHFKLTLDDEKLPFYFLDIMGVVPRAGEFKHCYRNVIHQKTDWGKLPVIGIRDLVEVKKTRRLEDYPIISNLVRIEYESLFPKKISSNEWKWILTNSFEIEDILHYLNTHDLAREAGNSLKRSCISSCLKSITDPKKKERYIDSASDEIALEIESLRKNDRKYWESIIKELKIMNGERQLLINWATTKIITTNNIRGRA
jgi:hypothetical protein